MTPERDVLDRACEAWHNADLESSRSWTPWAECLPEYKAHVRTCIAAALSQGRATTAEGDARKLAEQIVAANYSYGNALQWIDAIASALATLQAERDAAVAALEPFQAIGQWLFARRDVPDDEVMVTFEGMNGAKWHLTRKHFKDACLERRAHDRAAALKGDAKPATEDPRP